MDKEKYLKRLPSHHHWIWTKGIKWRIWPYLSCRWGSF